MRQKKSVFKINIKDLFSVNCNISIGLCESCVEVEIVLISEISDEWQK